MLNYCLSFFIIKNPAWGERVLDGDDVGRKSNVKQSKAILSIFYLTFCVPLNFDFGIMQSENLRLITDQFVALCKQQSWKIGLPFRTTDVNKPPHDIMKTASWILFCNPLTIIFSMVLNHYKGPFHIHNLTFDVLSFECDSSMQRFLRDKRSKSQRTTSWKFFASRHSLLGSCWLNRKKTRAAVEKSRRNETKK